jgi:hypothetical protein
MMRTSHPSLDYIRISEWLKHFTDCGEFTLCPDDTDRIVFAYIFAGY